MTNEPKKRQTLNIPQAELSGLKVTVKGISPLLINKVSERVLKEMEDNQTGISSGKGKSRGHTIRNPEQEFNEKRYLDEDGNDCIKTAAFKKAVIEAAKKDSKGTTIERSVSFDTEFAIIQSDPVVIDRRGVYIGSGRKRSLSLAYRPKYVNWSVEITILFESSAISYQQILTYLQTAGQGVGVGDFRPACGGNFGRFSIDTAELFVNLD